MNIDLHSVHLFAALDDAQLQRLRDSSHTLTLDAGQCLFEAGERALRFYLVLSGQVKLFRLSTGGDEKIFDVVQPGQTFAEALMFTDRPSFPVSAAALGPARVISFDSRCFKRILCGSMETCFRTMGVMSRRLRGLIKEVDDLTLQSATTRMCGMLVRCMEETGARRFELPATKGVLAARLSMKPETYSRISHDLSKRRIIEIHGGQVLILDCDALHELANAGVTAGLEPGQPCQSSQQGD